ncbi:hypothetical protein ACQEU3_46620 [Spirillospora sp. CA-253888]
MTTVQLVGGPLDGEEHDLDPSEDGAYMVVPGAEQRAVYEPDPAGDPARWLFRGWVP